MSPRGSRRFLTAAPAEDAKGAGPEGPAPFQLPPWFLLDHGQHCPLVIRGENRAHVDIDPIALASGEGEL